ncbi:unnamed protein product [Brassicogethes aeneus]|uniref:Cytochrome P450 n=1 Tax=Brassicogethes aeneus TaxID=1431903 RepID=A0A9P0BDJ1_BRAAE|nr:unnamed protein product [Brassicogethes aeneus]
MILPVVLFFTLCAYLIYFYRKSHNYWKNRGLEYVKPTIPFGNFSNFYSKKEGFGETFAKIYGEIKSRGVRHGGGYYFWNPLYIPTDPVIIKDIFISSFEHFKNHGFYMVKEDPMTQHLFNLEDDKWRDVRAKLSHCFTSGKMRNMFNVMVEHTDVLKRVLKEELSDKSDVKIKKILVRYTTDVVSKCLMGVNTDTLINDKAEILWHGSEFFSKTWGYINNTIVLLIPRAILQKLNFRITPKETEVFFKDLFKNIKSYREKNNDTRNDLFDSVLKLSDPNYTSNLNDFNGKKGMEPLNFDITVAQCYGFFVAGFETSSTTITFALYELAKNMDKQDLLRQDINDTLKKYNNELTYDSVQNMEYLEMVLKETLRLYPAFPFIPRGCNKDYKVPGTDFVVKKGTGVILSGMGIQRDPEYWPNPEKFEPQRFSIQNRDKIVPYTYFPFGEGPRLCIAHRFGQLQTKVGILTLIKDYKITINEAMKPLKFGSYGIVLAPRDDIWLNFERIN